MDAACNQSPYYRVLLGLRTDSRISNLVSSSANVASLRDVDHTKTKALLCELRASSSYNVKYLEKMFFSLSIMWSCVGEFTPLSEALLTNLLTMKDMQNKRDLPAPLSFD